MIIPNKIIKVIRDNAIFFILSKGVAFLAPLLFVSFVTIKDYGIIEYSYSTGSLLATGIGLGLSGAYPYFILKREDKKKEECFLFYGVTIFVLAILELCLRIIGIIPFTFSLILVFSFIFALQSIYSSMLKSNDKGYLGVLFDGGYYFILAIILVLCSFFKRINIISTLEIFMYIYLFSLCTLYSLRYLFEGKMKFCKMNSEIKEILFFSLKMVPTGFLIFWLTSSARIYIKFLLGYNDVGIYSFYFRLAGMSIVIYQFIYITFFKNVYLVNGAKIDSYYFVIMLLVFLGSISVGVCLPLLVKILDVPTINNYLLYSLLCLQMPLWIGIALFEGLAGRENIINKLSIAVGIFSILIFLALFILRGVMTLQLFLLINILGFGGVFESFSLVLKKTNIFLPKCRIFCRTSIFISILVYFVFNNFFK